MFVDILQNFTNDKKQFILEVSTNAFFIPNEHY